MNLRKKLAALALAAGAALATPSLSHAQTFAAASFPDGSPAVVVKLPVLNPSAPGYWTTFVPQTSYDLVAPTVISYLNAPPYNAYAGIHFVSEFDTGHNGLGYGLFGRDGRDGGHGYSAGGTGCANCGR